MWDHLSGRILPEWMQGVAKWMPQTYMIDIIRAATLGGATERGCARHLSPDSFGVFWLVTGYVLFNWMERRARQTGASGNIKIEKQVNEL